MWDQKCSWMMNVQHESLCCRFNTWQIYCPWRKSAFETETRVLFQVMLDMKLVFSWICLEWFEGKKRWRLGRQFLRLSREENAFLPWLSNIFSGAKLLQEEKKILSKIWISLKLKWNLPIHNFISNLCSMQFRREHLMFHRSNEPLQRGVQLALGF